MASRSVACPWPLASVDTLFPQFPQERGTVTNPETAVARSVAAPARRPVLHEVARASPGTAWAAHRSVWINQPGLLQEQLRDTECD